MQVSDLFNKGILEKIFQGLPKLERSWGSFLGLIVAGSE